MVMVVKVQKNKNITLPQRIITQMRLRAGDFVRLEETRDGVVLKPARLIDPSQAYFWTDEWQAGEREAESDIRAGRVKKAENVREMLDDLDD